MSKNRGFTLLELIIVIAIIALIAVVILPSLKSRNSQLTTGMQALAGQVRVVYDEALFTGLIHRMTFNVRTGEFWTEYAPKGFSGRAPSVGSPAGPEASEKQKLFDELKKDAKDTPFNIEIPVAQRSALAPVQWHELNTALIFKQKFPSNMVFAEIKTGVSTVVRPKGSPSKSDGTCTPAICAEIYFFPGGLATGPVTFWVMFTNTAGEFDDNGPKYTVKLNILTGRLQILPGIIDAKF